MVGRFNPLQLGHLTLLQHVRDHNEHMVVLVGSATESRTHKNPLTYEERKALILESFPAAVVMPLPDMPSDEDWVKLFESTIALGIQSLQLQGSVHARLYSADATRADDYALRCEWVRNLGHEVVPFKPVMARTDLSASLVRDNWYNGRYEEMRELVPPSTFALMQRLDIGWMRSAYVKKVGLGTRGAANAVSLAFVAEGAPASLGYVMRGTGELGFVGGLALDGEELTAAAVRSARLELGATLESARLELVSTHATTGNGPSQTSHLFIYRMSADELFELRGLALLATSPRSVAPFAFVATRLTAEAADNLRQQKWAGPALDELKALLWSNRVAVV